MNLQPVDYLIYGIGLLCLIIIISVLTKRWFWLVLFGICAVAALFATLYFLMNFQMQTAVGFIILTAILGMLYLKIWDMR